MSGASSMYTLKPVVSLPDRIPLPTVMYDLPKILTDGGEPSDDIAIEIGRQKPLPEYNLLESRQMSILKQLCELKGHVEQLCIAVRLSDVVKIQLADISALITQKPVHAEIIVNANPASLPYSILALQRIWKDTKFNIEIHRHSTASNVVTNSFEEKLLADKRDDAIHTVSLKLIWKDVNDVQLITKVYDYPIEGEANVLRYLTRLIEKYNYESSKSLTESSTVDTIFDLCLRLIYEEPRNVNAITAKFSGHLNENPWLLNSVNPTIVDVAVWSILKRVAQNRVPLELKNWYDLCEKTFLFA